jgi:hypothetical protein
MERLLMMLSWRTFYLQTIIPNLKYLRGDTFTEKHWYEVFSMLDMPRKSIAELTFGDFLTARQKIHENLKELKVKGRIHMYIVNVML